MLKKYVAVCLTAIGLACAGCEQAPPVEPSPPDKPPAVETPTQKTTPPEEKTEPPSKDAEPVKPTEPKEEEPTVEKGVEDMRVKVYYPDESGLRLVEVEREIEVTRDENKYVATVEAMMTPPTESELTEIFPKRARLLDVEVNDGVATVNFDEGLRKHFAGGSAGETFLIGSVVNALTNFNEIKEVRILINGEEIESLAGHMDLSAPLERMGYLMEQ